MERCRRCIFVLFDTAQEAVRHSDEIHDMADYDDESVFETHPYCSMSLRNFDGVTRII